MTRPGVRRGSIESILSEDDIRGLLRGSEGHTDDDTEASATSDEFEDAIMEQDEVEAAEAEKMNQSIKMNETMYE